MAGDLREEVVDGLELQAAVDPVEPGGAVDVEGGAELALREGLGVAEVSGWHAPVRQGDLDVQRHGDDVRDQDEGDADWPVGEGAPDEAVAEPEPVACDERYLGWAHPGCDSASAFGCCDEVVDGEDVEVEASDSHYWVVGVLLVFDGNVGKCVPDKSEVVVC